MAGGGVGRLMRILGTATLLGTWLAALVHPVGTPSFVECGNMLARLDIAIVHHWMPEARERCCVAADSR